MKYKSFFYLLLVFILLVPNSFLYGQKYILLVDVSGSLVVHDPQDLRKPSLRYFVDQLYLTDSLALYSFGEDVYIHKRDEKLFLPIGQNKQWFINEINRLPRGDQLTDMRAALRQILIDILDYESDEPINLFIFTDAQLKPGDIPRGIDINTYIDQVFDLGDKLAAKNVRIFGLAFTRIADLDYLETLAGKTLGNALLADTPEAANKAIMELLHHIRYGPHPPFYNIPIGIDETHASFTVHAFNRRHGQELPEIQLTNPAGVIDENIIFESYETAVTATKENPQTGRWLAYVTGARDVEVYFTKKVTYDVIFHSPRYRDLNVVQGSQIFFDIEITEIRDQLLDKFETSVSVLSYERSDIKRTILHRTDNRFKGSITIDMTPGVYRIQVDLQAPEEKISREYILNVEEGMDIQYSMDKDLVINNPVWISVSKPKGLDSVEFKILVNTPDNQTKEFTLFDDGLEQHGDALAGDGIYSNIIHALNDPGVYSVEIILLYEHAGMPVSNRKVAEVFKTISLKRKAARNRFPRESEWTIGGTIELENKSSHEIIIKEVIIEDEWKDRLDIGIQNDDKVVKPRDSYTLHLVYSGKNIPLGDQRIGGKILCDVVDARTGRILAENEIITLIHDLRVKPSLASTITYILIVTILLGVLLIIVGLTIITPRRFHNRIYMTEDGGEVYLNGLRKAMRPYVNVDESTKVGIAIFGYGYWYARVVDDDSTKTIRYSSKINSLRTQY